MLSQYHRYYSLNPAEHFANGNEEDISFDIDRDQLTLVYSNQNEVKKPPIAKVTPTPVPPVASKLMIPHEFGNALDQPPKPMWNYDCTIPGLYCSKQWGNIKNIKDNQCGSLKAQSPIDLTKNDLFPNFVLLYSDDSNSKDKSVNLGPLIRIETSGDSKISLDGEIYKLNYIDFHSPAEHTITNHTYDLEIQLHHFPVNKMRSIYNSVVISILLPSVSNAKSNYKSVWDVINDGNFPLIPQLNRPFFTDKRSLNLVKLGTHVIKNENSKLFQYTGSLTIPPCTTNVKWIVVVPSYHCGHFNQLLQNTVGPNNRPVQPRRCDN